LVTGIIKGHFETEVALDLVSATVSEHRDQCAQVTIVQRALIDREDPGSANWPARRRGSRPRRELPRWWLLWWEPARRPPVRVASSLVWA